MPLLNVQTVFLFYSAIGTLCALTLIALFWGKKDRSAQLWIYASLLTSISATGTVFRDYVPLILSYCLMISVWTFGAFLFAESLKSLTFHHSKKKLPWHVFILSAAMFFIQLYLLEDAGGKLIPLMAGISAFFWAILDIYNALVARKASQFFKSKFLFNTLASLYLIDAFLYFLRTVNVVIGYGPFAFDPNPFNLFVYFLIAVVTSVRGISYIVLRMHMNLSEHQYLNSINVRLSNIVVERNNMITSLEKLNKTIAVNAMASTVAHEVNQPLGASKLDAQFALHVLNEEPKNSSVLQETLKSIVANIDRASLIINNLRNLSKGRSSGIGYVDLKALLNRVISIGMPRSQSSQVKVRLHPCEPHSVAANEGELEQVFINLINNAFDELESISQAEKTIDVKVERLKGNALISISDNGRGVAHPNTTSIFQLLNTSKQEGSGIGLWLSQEIVMRYGGKISYQPALPHGACFQVSLPIATLRA